jgi:streptogramin lyase
MRKVVLTIGALLVSANIIAANAPHTVGGAIINAVQSVNSTSASSASFPLVYGGQDISRSRIATANETVWSGGSQSMIG